MQWNPAAAAATVVHHPHHHFQWKIWPIQRDRHNEFAFGVLR